MLIAARLFPASSTDNVNHGAASSLATLDPCTYIFWAYPTSLVNLAHFFNKTQRQARLNGTTGNVEFVVLRATTATNYVTNDTPFAVLSKWYYVAFTFSSSAAAGEVVNIYVGDELTPAAERSYGTAADGSGALNSDSVDSLFVGNQSGSTRPWVGRLYPVGIWNRLLSLDEIRKTQSLSVERARLKPGCVLAPDYGKSGVQRDLSPYGNHGTLTGTSGAYGPRLPNHRGRRRHVGALPDVRPDVLFVPPVMASMSRNISMVGS